MAGGQFTDYNKTLPGVYISYKTANAQTANVGARGTVAIAKQLPWGKESDIMEITDINKIKKITGLSLTSPELKFVNEMVKGSDLTSGATKILLCRLKETGGAKAKKVFGSLTVTSKYTGVRGNDLSIIISPVTGSIDSGTTYIWKIQVLLDMEVMEEFEVGTFIGSEDPGNIEGTIDLLKKVESEWVDFDGTGKITANAGANLEGGQNGTAISPDAHTEFLDKLGKKEFNVVIYDGTDIPTKAIYKAFVDRLCRQEGKYVMGVMANYTTANSEYIISVNNGVRLDTLEDLTPEQCTWWVGGATAGANYNESLTYHQYPGAIEVLPEYENSELSELVTKGNFLFFKLDGNIMVLTDINSFTSFTPEKSRYLSKNRVMRTVMQICNDLYKQYTLQYIGKVDVNTNGLNLIKSYGIQYLNTLQGNNAIKNFSTSDFVVEAFDIDTVTIAMNIQPVDSVEKIYIKMTIS